MALINCPECEKEVSDKAATCINCGFPLSSVESQVNNISSIQTEEAETKEPTKTQKLLGTIFAPIFLYVVIFFICAILFSGNTDGNKLGGSVLFALGGVFWIYAGFLGIIQKENIVKHLYALAWGIIGLLPLISFLTGWF